MIDRTKLRTYHDIFECIVSNPRCTITSIAKYIGHTGIGRRRATISQYVNNMYTRQISLKPNLYFKNLEKLQWKAYLCKNNERNNVGQTFEKLKKDEKITYVVLISGRSDFFLTSKNSDLNLTQYNVEIMEETQLFSPIYTHPQGWDVSFENAARNMLKHDFRQGLLPRKTGGIFEMEELDRKIFEIMKYDARLPFAQVTKKINVFSGTVKEHFYKKILPLCTVAHYFFPKGYPSYMKTYFRVHTEYEESLIKSLRYLPCTSYVYPFEEGLLINLFHENINLVMTMFQKMEEMGLIEYYTHYTPLWHEHF